MKYLKFENGFTAVDPSGNSLDLLQSLVGGYIERIPLFDDLGIDVWCNDEGKLQNLPVTAFIRHGKEIVDAIAGPLAFSGFDDEGETHPLTDTQIDSLADRLAEKIFYIPEYGRPVIIFDL